LTLIIFFSKLNFSTRNVIFNINIKYIFYRIKIDNQDYLDFEESINILHLLEKNNISQFSHGICDECKEKLDKELDSF